MGRARKLLLASALLIPAAAFGQPTPNYGPGPAPVVSPYQTLFLTTTSVGNGADTTEDVLQTFTLPAGQLKTVGDRLHVTAAGVLGATTDVKAVKLRLGGVAGTQVANMTATAAGSTSWTIDAWVTKSGANTQTVMVNGGVVASANAPTARNVTASVTDTATIAIVITGQNTTNSVAGSVTCQTFVVDYLPR